MRGFYLFVLFSTTLFASSNSHIKLLLDQNFLLQSEIAVETSQNFLNWYSVNYTQQQNFQEFSANVGYDFVQENILTGLDLSLYIGVGLSGIFQDKSHDYFPQATIKLLANKVFFPRVTVAYVVSAVKQTAVASTKVGLPLPTAFYDVSLEVGYKYESINKGVIDYEAQTVFAGIDTIF